MLLLDTHSLVWWLVDSRKLGPRATKRLMSARAGEVIVSVVSWYELHSLRGGQRLAMRRSVSDIRQEVLREGVMESELTASIAIDAGGLAGLSGDPMDKLIVATARDRHATLLTADSAILSWKGDLQRLDATA